MKPYIILCLLASCFVTWAQHEKKHITEGDKFYYQDLFDDAAKEYEKAVDIAPNSFDANFKMGLALERGVRPADCLRYFEKAQEIKPKGEEELIYLLARGLQLNYRFDEAVKYYTLAQKDKNVHKAYNKRIVDKSLYINEEKIAALIKQCEYGKKIVLAPLDIEIHNLGPNINGKFPDYVPVINGDESILIFTSRREGSKDPYTGHHYEEVYVSVRDTTAKNSDNVWSPAKNIGKTINSANRNESAVSMSADGKILYIYDEKDLFYCTLEGKEWSKPQPLIEVNSKYWETHCSIANDGKTLYFTSDRPGGKGGLDIYYCEKQSDGKWGTPKNMSELNTEFDEEAPFIHPDGISLYFSSRGHTTMGGYDIFKSVRDANGKWSTPENIGFPINTAADDVYFVLSADKKQAYFSSAREDSYGDKDIYVLKMPEPKVLVTVDNTNKPVVVTTIVKGRITNERTGTPLEADIIFKDIETNATITTLRSDANGNYTSPLPSGRKYSFIVTKTDYNAYNENFELPISTESKEYTKDAKIKSFKVGTKVVLRNIFYDYDKYELRPQSKEELNRLANIMTEYPHIKIQINSHTDADGAVTKNQILSENRAKSVVDYLVKEKGVDAKRLQYKGFGETAPIDVNTTPEGMQNNRRTEFEVIED